MNMQTFKAFLIFLAVLAAFSLAGAFDWWEEQRQVRVYCEMVDLWKQSGGKEGWPAFNGELDECKRY
jgi:hypothetical protein